MHLFSKSFLTVSAAILVCSVVMFASSAHGGETKIGYVDLQRAIQEVNDGKAAKEAIKKDFDARQSDLTRQQDRLQKIQEELETQGMLMKEDVRRAKAEEYQRLLMELQQSVLDHQKSLGEKEAEVTAKILGTMEGIVRQIAEENGLDYVFEMNQAGLIVAPKHMEITNEVIRRYNTHSSRKKQSGKKPAKGKK